MIIGLIIVITVLVSFVFFFPFNTETEGSPTPQVSEVNQSNRSIPQASTNDGDPNQVEAPATNDTSNITEYTALFSNLSRREGKIDGDILIQDYKPGSKSDLDLALAVKPASNLSDNPVANKTIEVKERLQPFTISAPDNNTYVVEGTLNYDKAMYNFVSQSLP